MTKRVPIKHLFEISRNMVMPNDYGNEPLFHYSLPAWHEHGDGVIENASDLASGKLLLKGGEVLVSKLNPEKSAVLLAVEHEIPTVCSPEFIALVPKKIDRKFAYYFMLSGPLRHQLNASVESVTNSHKRARVDRFLASCVDLPDLPTQRAIADFLDRETARIDLLIQKKQRFIEVIKNKLDAKIFEIITSGVQNHYIDPNVDLNWQRGIPDSWQVRKVKHLFRLVADPAHENNDYELLSIYTAIGVRPRKDLEERGNKASTTDGYWKVRKGDIVVNKLLAWMGAIGVSEYNGVTSPAYDILRSTQPLEPFYYHYLFRIPRFSSELKRHSRGIMEMRLRLYFEKFGEILVPVPPVEEQRAIVSALRSKEKEHDILSTKTVQSIDRLKEYRSALITAAVTGQIDVSTCAKSGATDRRLDAIQEEMGA